MKTEAQIVETAEKSEESSSAEIVYTELNLEKWSIWEPSSSKKPPRARIMERQRILQDGSHVTAKVEIGFTQHGNLSTRDQKIYYVLFKLWDDAGRPETPVTFSLQKITRELGEEWGSSVRRSIIRSLLQLRGVLFVWENSYFDKTSGEHIELLDTFNILSELSIARRTRKLHATTEMCLFQFHREILKNLQANYTTPLFLATVLSFKSEIAQLLYPRLDLLLSDKKHYERRTKELFEELGLEGETYRHRSARKRVIEKALNELQGAPLTTGCIVSATVEATKDNTDFKIVIYKGPRRKSLAPATRKFSPKPAAEAKTDEAPNAERQSAQRQDTGGQLPLIAQAETQEAILVRDFHEQFHGTPLKGALNPKELVQAARLIQQHSFTKARALIDYAKVEAAKTSYAPASLNGILQYEARFDAEHAAREREGQERRERLDQQRCAQEAREAHQREIIGGLMERVGEVKKNAPQAFTAFLRHIEAERSNFLATPIARQAKLETREMLSREYDRPGKRLELFIDFFKAGSEGEALLSMCPKSKNVSHWLQQYGEAARSLTGNADLEKENAKLLQE